MVKVFGRADVTIEALDEASIATAGPFDDRKRSIEQQFATDYQRRLADPTLGTDEYAVAKANDALTANTRARHTAMKTWYDGKEAAIWEHRAQLHATAADDLRRAVASMNALRDYERGAERIALRCQAVPMPPTAEATVNNSLLASFEFVGQRRLERPKAPRAVPAIKPFALQDA